MGIYVETYKGTGIYKHAPIFKGQAWMFGDETNRLYSTIKEYKAAIDTHIAQMDSMRHDHEKYWDSLPHDERAKWRKLCKTSELSASELAYTNRHASA